MNDRLGKIEDDLRRELDAARARGWRDEDIRHAFRKFPQAYDLDLLEHLDDGLAAWQQRRGIDDEGAIRAASFFLLMVRRLGRIPPVEDHAPRSGGVLTKVRALLAKAESTEFSPEADALYAKAHELMTRHSIDQARLAGAAAPTDITARRVLIDDPYAAQRLVLLCEVAAACGCQVLSMRRIGLATVFGAPDDVHATELLFTSLLLQATQAVMTSADTPHGAPASTIAAFRRAFFIGFAHRVGLRLSELRQTVIEETAAQTTDLLPVLASREQAIDEAISAYSTRVRRGPQVSNISGLIAGEAAGARASLATQGRVGGSRNALRA